MTEEFRFDFGIEEFAVALSLVKKVEEAKGLLINTFGKLSQEEEKGRLLAAYNSLFARSLITFDNNEAGLHPEIKKLLDIFFDSHKLIKAVKAVDSGESVVSYYFHQNIWLEHSITQGVAYHFLYPVNEQMISEKIRGFLAPITPLKVPSTSISLPAQLLLSSPPGTLSNYDTVLTIINKDASKATPEMKHLAEDISDGKWRGSTVWMDHPAEDQLLTRGYLWVQGKERLWVINSNNSNAADSLLATLCSQNDFDTKITELISTKAEI